LDPRTKARYDNAIAEGMMDQISPFARGYELEEIGHEEDPVKALRMLEAEGWMKILCPSWTLAKADLKGLEELNHLYVKLLMLGVNPDPSAAHMELLTARMPPKDIAGLKKQFPRTGFVEQWNHLEQSAKEFSKHLLGKEAATPSAAWKLLTSYEPEAVLWLAYSAKAAPLKEKFNNFFNVWPEARQKIPTALMAEMRITPDLPEFGKVAEALFFQFMDGKLQTEEELRAFLQPYSPPAPPPPVVIRRSRGRRAEPKFEEDEELEPPVRSEGEEGEEEEAEEESEALPPRPAAKAPAKGAKAEKGAPAKVAKEQAKPVAPHKAEAKAPVKAAAPAPHNPAKSPQPATPAATPVGKKGGKPPTAGKNKKKR
jgi:tRNA nucleotidyltransferase (CCA-adding enzyme)